MKKKIVLFGDNIYVELVYFYFTYDSPFDVVGFTVNEKYLRKDRLFGLPMVAFESVQEIFPTDQFEMFLSISYQRLNRFREERYCQAKAKGYHLATYISSKAVRWNDLVVGDNCIVSENTSIGPCVTIGNNVTIGPNVVIGHHAQIGDHCFISPGAVVLGGARIGPYSLLGANSTIKEGTSVGSECVIGSGVAISNNTREKRVYLNKSLQLLNKPSDELRGFFSWNMQKNKGEE